MNIYLAAPLFSEGERLTNVRVADAIGAFGSVFLPQRDGDLLPDLVDDGVGVETAIDIIWQKDMLAIATADILVAVLDGGAIDEGVAFELGVAYALKKPCFGLQTDFRRTTLGRNNPMIERSLMALTHSVSELCSEIQRWSAI